MKEPGDLIEIFGHGSIQGNTFVTVEKKNRRFNHRGHGGHGGRREVSVKEAHIDKIGLIDSESRFGD